MFIGNAFVPNNKERPSKREPSSIILFLCSMEYSVIFYKREVYNRDKKQRREADKFRIQGFEVIYLI